MAMKFICFVHQHQKHNECVSLQVTKFKYVPGALIFSLIFERRKKLTQKYQLLPKAEQYLKLGLMSDEIAN